MADISAVLQASDDRDMLGDEAPETGEFSGSTAANDTGSSNSTDSTRARSTDSTSASSTDSSRASSTDSSRACSTDSSTDSSSDSTAVNAMRRKIDDLRKRGQLL